MSNEDNNYYANLIRNFEQSEESQWETVSRKSKKKTNVFEPPPIPTNVLKPPLMPTNIPKSPPNIELKSAPNIELKSPPNIELKSAPNIELKSATTNEHKPSNVFKTAPTSAFKSVNINGRKNRRSKNRNVENVTPLSSSTPINDIVSVAEIEKDLVSKNTEKPVENETITFNELIKMIMIDTDKAIVLLGNCDNLAKEIDKINKIKYYVNMGITQGLFSNLFPNELNETDFSLCTEIINFISNNETMPVANFEPIVEVPPQAPLPQQHYQVPPQPAPQQAPQQHYQAPQQHYQAPQQHYQAPQQYYQVPPQQTPLQQHYQAPLQQHYQAPPQQHYQAPPQQHYQAPQQHYQVPQQHYQAPPQQHYQMPQAYQVPVLAQTQGQNKIYIPPFKRQTNFHIQEVQPVQQVNQVQENDPFKNIPLGLFFGSDSIWSPK